MGNFIANLKEHLERVGAAADVTIAKFEADFHKLPWNALEWSSDVFTAAARKQVVRDLLLDIEADKATPKQFADYIRKEALRRAMDRSSSTCPASNLVRASFLRAWADLAQHIDLLES